jgi:hypothetical protein
MRADILVSEQLVASAENADFKRLDGEHPVIAVRNIGELPDCNLLHHALHFFPYLIVVVPARRP